MNKLIGYMEGTNPLWLTTLQVLGCDTMPLSNGFDGHGLNVQLISAKNKPDLILCWLHKLISPKSVDLSVRDLLHATTEFGVMVLVACPAEYHEVAVRILDGKPRNVRIVAPDELLNIAEELVK